MTITELQRKYKYKLDDIDIKLLQESLEKEPLEDKLNRQLYYLDCTRVDNGLRLMQTINVTYNYEISKTIYLLNYTKEILGEDRYKEYCNKLIKLHEDNLSFEKDNPPVIYAGKKKSNSSKKTTKANKPPKEKLSKEDKKKLKIQEKIKSLGFGSFKLITPKKE